MSFAREDGQPVESFCVVETVGVNGPHAVVLAPVLVRIEMLRKASTYELLITQHRPGQAGNGKRPQLEARILFRGVHGRLELDLSRKDKTRAGTVLPASVRGVERKSAYRDVFGWQFAPLRRP